MAKVVIWILAFPTLLWGALALHFAGPRPVLLADALAAALVLAGLVVLLRVRPAARTIAALAVLALVFSGWWSTVRPQNDRSWLPDVAETATAELAGDRLTVRNVRNFDYRTETDFTPHWDTRTFDLARLEGLDLFMSYWGSPSIAHTIMSWSFSDGQHLAISIETRKEQGEEYSTVAGFFRQYEIYYVVADERDVVRLRTNHRVPREQVYLYQLRTPLARARAILLDYVVAINRLAAKPEFYNAGTGNCTTTIRTHVDDVGASMPLDWRIIANGYLDEMLYEYGVIDTSRSFLEVRQTSLINPRAESADRAPDFSARIRDGLVRPPLIVLP
jgi:hypothetical protein